MTDRGRPGLYTDGNGHEEFRERSGTGENSLKHHRVLAYCWGLLPSLDDPREVDHLIEVPWLNADWNFQLLPKGDHSQRTRAREYQRRAEATHRTLAEYGGDP